MCSILNGSCASRAKQPRRKNEKREEKPSSLSKKRSLFLRFSSAFASLAGAEIASLLSGDLK